MSLAVISTFLSSSLGKYAMIGLALVVWTVYQREQAVSNYKAKELSATLAEKKRQEQVVWDAGLDAEKQQAVTDKEIAVLNQQKADADAEVAKLSSRPCVIPELTRRKLQNIR